jgi:hypothetical protein
VEEAGPDHWRAVADGLEEVAAVALRR